MRSKMVRMLTLALLLGGVGVVLAQQPPAAETSPKTSPPAKRDAPVVPQKSTLEDMLVQALKNNPDIRVAAAKLAMADAELNQARLLVMQKVISAHAAIQTQRAEVAYRQKQYDRYKELAAQKTIDAALVDEAQQRLAIAKGKLAELEAQMLALLGKETHVGDSNRRQAIDQAALESLKQELLKEDLNPTTRRRIYLDLTGTVPPPADMVRVRGPMAERIRKALQTPVKVSFKDMSLDAIFVELTNLAPGLLVRSRGDFVDDKINLQLAEAMPLSAILQALADETGYRFYVREYGILVTSSRVTPPPGALSIEEFLRSKSTDDPRSQPSRSKNAPAEHVEGVVKAVDGSSGLMTITIGSEAGLQKGHTLELFYLDKDPKKSKYLGTIRILEVSAHESVAQPIGKLARPPQTGDRVSSRIVGK